MFSEFFEYYEQMFNSHQKLLLNLLSIKFKTMKSCCVDLEVVCLDHESECDDDKKIA